MAVSLDDGPYRLTIVRKDGTATARKIKRGLSVRRAYEAAKLDPTTHYVGYWELTEDVNFAGIKDEWHARRSLR